LYAFAIRDPFLTCIVMLNLILCRPSTMFYAHTLLLDLTLIVPFSTIFLWSKVEMFCSYPGEISCEECVTENDNS
jgi:hypothetical protein